MSPYLQILLICLTIVFVIVLYGTFRCKITTYKDPLTFTLIKDGPFGESIDGWSITHFCLFAILAYMYPSWKYLLFIVVLGISWEIVESVFKDHPFYLSKCKYNITNDNGVGWWYGKYSDILVNSLGMACGLVIRNYVST
jgi:hypothetical protein